MACLVDQSVSKYIQMVILAADGAQAQVEEHL